MSMNIIVGQNKIQVEMGSRYFDLQCALSSYPDDEKLGTQDKENGA